MRTNPLQLSVYWEDRHFLRFPRETKFILSSGMLSSAFSLLDDWIVSSNQKAYPKDYYKMWELPIYRKAKLSDSGIKGKG